MQNMKETTLTELVVGMRPLSERHAYAAIGFVLILGFFYLLYCMYFVYDFIIILIIKDRLMS